VPPCRLCWSSAPRAPPSAACVWCSPLIRILHDHGILPSAPAQLYSSCTELCARLCSACKVCSCPHPDTIRLRIVIHTDHCVSTCIICRFISCGEAGGSVTRLPPTVSVGSPRQHCSVDPSRFCFSTTHNRVHMLHSCVSPCRRCSILARMCESVL
jgi:hypothetical protein